MKRRKHLTAEQTEAAAVAKLGDQVEMARDIRTLPLATAKLQDAIAGRVLINRVKEIGKETAEPTVDEGAEPTNSEYRWFTIDHPAFKIWRPKLRQDEATGKWDIVKDENGEPVMERVPLYVRSDFEGPLRAVMSQDTGKIYQSMMDLKGKTMSVIMYSPLIHNAVEFGCAFPAMPGKAMTMRVYFDGYAARHGLAYSPAHHAAFLSGVVGGSTAGTAVAGPFGTVLGGLVGGVLGESLAHG